MASPFDEIDTAGQAVIEDRLGEAVTFIGMTGGDYSTRTDDTRPAMTVQAVVAISPRSGGVSESIQGRGSTDTSRAYMNSEIMMIKATFEALDWEPVRNDVVVIDAGTPKERRFTVSAVLPSEFGDVQIKLSGGRKVP